MRKFFEDVSRLFALVAGAAIAFVAGSEPAAAQFASTTYPSTALPALPPVSNVTQVLAPASSLSFAPAQSTTLQPSAASMLMFVDQLAQQQDAFTYGDSFGTSF